MNVQRIEVTIKKETPRASEEEKQVVIEGDPVAANVGELCVVLDNIIRPESSAQYTYHELD